jgi:molecular chaperone DnaJ
MASVQKDFYDVLGLTFDAEPGEVERAYRELMSQLDDELQLGADAEEVGSIRQEIHEAYIVLRNASDRRAYDALRESALVWGAEEFDSDYADDDEPGSAFLEAVLRRFLVGSEDREVVDLVLPFELAALGGRARLRLPVRAGCPICGGTGGAGGGAYTCTVCGGSAERADDCEACRGRGWRIVVPCDSCDGSGWQAAFGVVGLRIPPGTRDGTLIPFPGFGRGTREASTGPRYVRVRVSRHPFFKRRGRDVICRVPISREAAQEGSTIQVPTLRGRPTSLRIPPHTTDGTVMRIEGGGIDLGGRRGDQLVVIQIDGRGRATTGDRR